MGRNYSNDPDPGDPLDVALLGDSDEEFPQALYDLVDPSPSVEDQIDSRRAAVGLQTILNNLPTAKYRAVLIHRYYDGLSAKATAELLDYRGTSSVYKYEKRALLMLQHTHIAQNLYPLLWR